MYKVLIIGAGAIAGGYDSLESTGIKTHAKAYKLNNECSLLGFYDINKSKAIEMAKKWDVKYYENLNKGLKDADIVSICTPDNTHSEILLKTLDYNLKGIIVEKPIAISLKQTTELLEYSGKTKIIVNYPRAYNKCFIELRENIKNNKYGKLICGYGNYGKGLLHNGSHLLNIIEFLLSEELQIGKVFNRKQDIYENDLNYDFELITENNASICIQSISSIYYTIFEWSLCFEKVRLKFRDSGFKLVVEEVIEDKRFQGYTKLGEELVRDTMYDNYMEPVISSLVKNISNNEDNGVNIIDAVRTMKYIDKIRNERFYD